MKTNATKPQHYHIQLVGAVQAGSAGNVWLTLSDRCAGASTREETAKRLLQASKTPLN
jgi:hypothetical protein